jgi:5'-3' exonuclease
MINLDDLFFGKFEVHGRIYEVTEDHYLAIDAIDEYTSVEALISAAKHIALQHNGETGHIDENVSHIRDIKISQDPIDFEGTVLIFDANNTAHRARHAVSLSHKNYVASYPSDFGRHLDDKHEVPNTDVSVSYGFLNILQATIKKFKRVTSVIVCWDGGVPQFRYDRVPTYKQRDHSDDEDYQEFLRQVKELHEVLPSFGVYSLRKDKTEADDLMYHVSRLIHPDYQKVIVSTDKDLLQCINRDTAVWQPYHELLIDRSNFKAHTGLNQADYLTYRCMVGDGSDGITGIKGIGEKTALKLIEDYGASPSNFINVANGLNPDTKPMSAAIAEKMKAFGIKGFADIMTAIRLDIDRCGAKLYIASELKKLHNYDPIIAGNFLRKYAFVSLMSSQFYDCFKDLQRPTMTGLDLRYPRVFDTDKHPVK